MTDQEDKLDMFLLRPNPEIKPSFAEGTPFRLKRNYTWQESINGEYLTKGVCCVVRECGLSKYPIDTEKLIQEMKLTGKIESEEIECSPFSDGIEWCKVDIIKTGITPDRDEGCVRADDLEPY